MGLIMWIVVSAAAAIVARMIPAGRILSWKMDAAAAIAAGLMAGVIATALDFGGWNELEPQAALFVAPVAFGAIAVARLLAVRSQRHQA